MWLKIESFGRYGCPLPQNDSAGSQPIINYYFSERVYGRFRPASSMPATGAASSRSFFEGTRDNRTQFATNPTSMHNFYVFGTILKTLIAIA